MKGNHKVFYVNGFGIVSCNLHNKDFCLKWHFKNHKRGKHKFELGTRSEPKTGKCGKISQKGGGSDQIPLFYVRLPNFFACQNHPEVLKHVLQKWEVDM